MAVLNIDFADFEKLINEVEDAAGRFNSAYSKFQGRSNGTWNEEVNELAKFASPENQAFTYLDRVFQDVESRFESLVKWLRSALRQNRCDIHLHSPRQTRPHGHEGPPPQAHARAGND